MKSNLQCLLFDLDGTLLDTSMDFAYALNQLLMQDQRAPLPYHQIRETVSSGGLAMTQLAYPDLEGDPLLAKRDEFIALYHENITRHTQLFATLDSALTTLMEKKIPWGIVTNKPTHLTESLLAQLTLPHDPQVLICGDTLPVRKPHPEPLLLAAEKCGLSPQQCLYLGDHPRDIEAGIQAGMKTGAALFGYLPNDAQFPNSQQTLQQADFQFHTPYEITQFIQGL